MIRGTLVALSMVAVVASFAPATQAQSSKPRQSERENVTLSGESLRGIRGRTVDKDFQIFFPQTIPITRQNSGTLTNGATSQESSGVRLPDGTELDVSVGDTRNNQNATPYLEGVRRNEQDDGVKVQLQLGQ